MRVANGLQQPVLPEVVESTEKILEGYCFNAKVTRRKGEPFIDGIFRYTAVQSSDDKGLVLASKELRIIRSIELGKKFTVPMPDIDKKGSRGSLEIIVEKVKET